MAVPGVARRIKEVEAYKQAVSESRIFYRRGLARAIVRDFVSSAIQAGVATMFSKPDIATFAVEVADRITKHLERLEEAELHVH
jgi:hypothetical protein